ncbi:uncharacterized protein [Penaeus vannamei]|uniref:uncharacterized protein n=1 Tax=Penaeus vannamei TaxID=6689 RepID=UPI00387F7A64
MFAECDPVSSTCSCPADMYQDGVRCRHDFSASGFSLYDGRWVLVRSGLIPISWDLALLYCNNRYANMFIPRSSSDWSWMMSKMGILDFGCFVPINDKAVEGQLVWNDGTSIAGDTVVVWNQNVVGSGNFLLNNCAAVTKIPFVGAKTSMGLCFLLLNFVTVCEAMPEALENNYQYTVDITKDQMRDSERERLCKVAEEQHRAGEAGRVILGEDVM